MKKGKLKTMLIAVLALASTTAMAQSVITLTWNTEAEVEKSIGIVATYGKTFTIDWGDGISEQKIGASVDIIPHTYTDAGSYDVSITAAIDCSITHFYCNSNQLTALDVSKNTELTWLNCSSNQLTALDVSKNTKLTTLLCDDNQLTTLDVNQNTKLTWLYCSTNQLTALDVSKNTELKYLYCYSNQLTSLDVSKHTKLITLWCYNNRLPLSDLYVISEKISEPFYKSIGTQTFLQQSIVVNTPYGGGQNVFAGIYTEYSDIEKNSTTASASDYSIADGQITFNTEGVYTFTMTNTAITSQEGYPMVMVTLNVGNLTGISNITANKIKVYPNPTKGQLIIENEELGMGNIEIFDRFGNLTPAPSPNWRGVSEGRGEVNISHLPAGVYFLKIGRKIVKVMKE